MFTLPGQRALRRLIRVIPVAQTQVHHDIAVTILSLDCYEHGYDVHMYLWRDTRDDLLPHFHVRVLYDGEQPKRSGGSGPKQLGVHSPGDPHRYFSFRRNPALDASVRNLQLIIPVIHLAEIRPHDTMRLVRDVPGPWVFVVPSGQGIAAKIVQPVAEPDESYDWAWANHDRVREYRASRLERAMPHYGPLYDAVLEVIYRYDPWWVGWKGDVPFGAEEYTTEADKIVPRLSETQSVKAVRSIVYEVMHDYYGKTPGGEERFTDIAQEIWQVLRKQRDLKVDRSGP